ncbi:hypothetical protein HPB52_023240 [Rhipicephalus sanguineus]|uniref:Uncharacterized protein n=1 Tax=Rhipicephalus sanguineus TaxID=34632 RepID=A0A9D4PXV5_RHISA|nr:hypothetical protein HPB52_023240 [Rhipicephalus sanguineus]
MEPLLRADPGPDPRIVIGPNRGADLARGAGPGTRRERSISRVHPNRHCKVALGLIVCAAAEDPAKR